MEKIEIDAYFKEGYLIITTDGEEVRRTKVNDGKSYEFRVNGDICNFFYEEKKDYAHLYFYPLQTFSPQQLNILL